jgi:hypothetical protein
MTGKDQRPSLQMAAFAAVMLTSSAVWMIWLAARNDPRLHAPRFAVAGVAAAFIVASVMAVLSARGIDRYRDVLIIPLLGGLGAAFGGVALFGDERYCSASGPPFLPLPGCRPVFGAGALLFAVVVIALIRRLWRRRPGRRRQSHY